MSRLQLRATSTEIRIDLVLGQKRCQVEVAAQVLTNILKPTCCLGLADVGRQRNGEHSASVGTLEQELALMLAHDCLLYDRSDIGQAERCIKARSVPHGLPSTQWHLWHVSRERLVQQCV